MNQWLSQLFLQGLKRLISSITPDKVICFLHHLVQRDSLFAQTAYKPAQSRNTTRQTLDVINARRLSHRDQKTQELTWWHAKDTFIQVKHHFVNLEIVRGLLQIIYQGLLLSGFHHNVVHISMNIAPNLTM